MLPVIILAGGLATRLRPVTERIPKSMIDIHGNPFVDYQLKLLRDKGIGEVTFCVGYLGEMIERYVGDGREFGLRVRYSYDGDTLLGTGGAVLKAVEGVCEPFFVLYGDSYLDIDYMAVEEAYGRCGRSALMTVYQNDGQWDASNAVYQDGAVVRYSKKHKTQEMRHIDYGLSVLDRSAFGRYPLGSAFDLAEVCERLALEGQLGGYEVFTRFYEVGSKQGIGNFMEFMAGRSCRENICNNNEESKKSM